MLYIKGSYRPLNIYGYIPDILRAGGHLATIKLLEELKERGHNVVLGSRSNVFNIESRIKIYVNKDPEQLKKIYKGADVVISTGRKCRGSFNSKPLILYMHSIDDSEELKECIIHAKLIVVNSEWMQKKLNQSSIVVYPKIKTCKITSSNEYITMINLNERKNPNLFYSVAKLLPNHKFLGVKGGWGPEKIPAKLPPNVTLMNSTADVFNNVYNKTRILLMPSPTESWGMVGMEAMQCGIPVLSACSPGGIELLGKQNGCLKNDPKLWAEEILKYDNQHYYKERSEQMRKRYQELSCNNQVDLLEEEILKLLGAHPVPISEMPVAWWEKIMQVQKNPMMCLTVSGEQNYGYVASTAIVNGPIYVGKNTKIDHFTIIDGPVYIGDNVIIGSHSRVRAGSFIGDNVIVGSYTDVKASIVHNNVNIGPASAIHDSYIEANSFLGGVRCASLKINDTPMKVMDGKKLVSIDTNKMGCYFGEGCSVATGIIFPPGRRVEAGEVVKWKM